MASHKAKRPQPVMTRAGIVTAIAVLAALLTKVGAGSVSTWLQQNSDWIAGVILAAGPIVSGVLARRQVTPLDNPVSASGEKLVPQSSVSSLAAVATVLSGADAALAEANAIHPAAAVPATLPAAA